MAFVHTRPDPHADERAALMGWFDLQRGIIATKCTGLPDELAHRALIPTSPLMTVAGIVAHLTWAERLWFEHSLLDIPGTGPGFDDIEDSEFLAAVDRPLAEVLEDYDRRCQQSNATIAGLDLDALARRPSRHGAEPTLRWIIVHMIEETARHAGHLDILRELLDGETAYF